MKKLLIFSALAAALSLTAAPKVEFSPAKTVTTVSFAKKAPVVDGKISPNEYTGSFENFGMVSYNSAFLATRQAKSFAAIDGQYLYLACQSELPDPESKVKLKKRFKKRDSQIPIDDCVEFLFMPKGGKALYHLILNPADVSYDILYPVVNGGVSTQVSRDWDPEIKVKSTIENKLWTIEARIPLKEMGVKPGKRNQDWYFQFARTWNFPRQQCSFNKATIFANVDHMNPVKFAVATPVVRFTGMGNYAKGDHNIAFKIDNPTAKPVKIRYQVFVTSEAAPRNLDNEIVVAPGKTESVALKFVEKARVSCDMNILFTDAATGKILLQRTLGWQLPQGQRWITPDLKTGAQLEIGVYPYYKLIRARIGNHGSPINVQKVTSAVMRITDEKGNPVSKDFVPVKQGTSGFYAEMPLPALKKGNYFVEARLKKSDGKVDVYKAKFYFNKFEWEHNKIGMDRIVLPPYKPLQYSGKSVKTLMSRYDFDRGFFKQIASGKAEKLLAEPVVLKINGQVPGYTNYGFRWIEKSKDLAIVEDFVAITNGPAVNVRHELEFDNFIKTTVTVDPGKSYKFNSMTLDIPLNTAFAKQIHATCNTMKYNIAAALPEKQGELWNSMQGKIHTAVSNNFRPYIWVGNMGEGLAFFAESDKNWSRDPKKPMAQVIREGNKTILRINFVDKPTVRSKPFKLVFGFQATPTRTRPNSSRQLTERFSAPNSVRMSLLAGAGCWAAFEYDFWPINKDYTFLNELKKSLGGKGDRAHEKAVIEKMMRHFKNLPIDRQGFYQRHMDRGFIYARISDVMVPYMNPRATHLRWEEYQVFMDEWFCSDFRANNEDDYNNTPSKSYQDFLLYCNRKLVREGLQGIYYDNIRDWHNPNPVTGPAYVMENGKVQPYFDIFDMRNLIKRTAIMVYQEGTKIFDNRPLLVLHMTNTNLVPFMSLGSIQLDMEAMFGAMDFQDRFTEDYIKVCTLGLQTGCIPEVLIQISGNNKEFVTRTFLAVTLAYDIPMVLNGGGPTAVWNKTWTKLKGLGYGTDKMEVFPCFAPSGKVSTDAKKLRLTEYRLKDGRTLVAACSFGHAGKAKIKFAFPVKEARNLETGKALPFSGNTVEIDLKKHDFRLISVK
ncbi:MAG: hypothetical protein IJW23_01570 [Lentisphaeria bacterium]|nr:hypothetical protein [Lentisphaeria bacterium]